MAKILAAMSFILSASEAALGAHWLVKAQEHDWNPKHIFYGIVWLLSAVMQIMVSFDVLSAEKEDDVYESGADWDDFDEYED